MSFQYATGMCLLLENVGGCVHAGRPEVVTLNISNWPVLFRIVIFTVIYFSGAVHIRRYILRLIDTVIGWFVDVLIATCVIIKQLRCYSWQQYCNWRCSWDNRSQSTQNWQSSRGDRWLYPWWNAHHKRILPLFLTFLLIHCMFQYCIDKIGLLLTAKTDGMKKLKEFYEQNTFFTVLHVFNLNWI